MAKGVSEKRLRGTIHAVLSKYPHSHNDWILGLIGLALGFGSWLYTVLYPSPSFYFGAFLALGCAGCLCPLIWLWPLRKTVRLVLCSALLILTFVLYVKYGGPLIKEQPSILTVLSRMERMIRDLPGAVAARLGQEPPAIITPKQAPLAEVAPQLDPRIQFTISPLWTVARKKFVAREISAFERYLAKYNLVTIPETLPLFKIVEGKQTSYVFISPANPPIDGRQIPIATQRLTPFQVRVAYGEFLFATLLENQTAGLHGSNSWTKRIYSEYFAATSLEAAPQTDAKSLNGWVLALWEIRDDLGPDFTDRALLYGLKSSTQNSDDVSNDISWRLWTGVMTVKNDENQLMTVTKILKRHALLR